MKGQNLVIPGNSFANGYLNTDKPTAHLVECKLPFVQVIATGVLQHMCSSDE